MGFFCFMKDKIFIVVTSIAAPNDILRELTRSCVKNDCHFIVIGDEASPDDFHIDGCDFYSLQKQTETGLKFARNLSLIHISEPTRPY